jgi:DNA processing protein
MRLSPPAAYAAALADLPGAGPVGLGRLLSGVGGDPVRAWDEVLAGRQERPAPRSTRSDASARPRWVEVARGYDVAAGWGRLQAAGIHVTWPGQATFPVALQADPAPPAVLFWRGDLARALSRPAVALVGTRRATASGRDTALELGRDLAAAGVCVVSGLALGIDGAAHRGAVATGEPGSTIGVAASGVDRVYPRRHAALWDAVVAVGAVVSETPPGRGADAWRFPARNRIIAGLVSMVVVVESHAAGGSLITADAAIARGIEVRAVPGPVRSPASAGTNQLLFDGPGPVRDANDILEGLGLLGIVTKSPRQAVMPPGRARSPAASARPSGDHGGVEDLRRATPGAGSGAAPPPAPAPDRSTSPSGQRPGPSTPPTPIAGMGPLQQAVLGAVGWTPTSLNRVVDASGYGVAEVATVLELLVDAGLVVVEGDWWQRRR